MQGSPDLLLRAYQDALSELNGLDRRLSESLSRIVSTAQGGAAPSVKDLAFLEGIRCERDEARSSLCGVEREIFDCLLSRLGLSGPAT